MVKETILLIEDEEHDQEHIRQRIEKHYQLKIAASYRDALKALQREDFDYIFLDLRLPENQGGKVDKQGTFGVKLLKHIKEKLPLVPVVVISGLQSSKTAIRLLEYGIVDFVDKDDLDIWLETLVKKGQLLKDICLQNKILRHEILGSPKVDGLITKSKLWENIKTTITQAAPIEETILITGETGTGKELVAREIVNLSPRKESIYLPINCTQFSGNLLDSELFGYEKGAFTGANERKHGIFEAANNGTILLDEIGDITEEMQAKLLRLLQAKEFLRVGGTEAKKVNVRIIAATGRNLEQMIEEGEFRQDLYHRLNRVRIHIPPLRERKEDIEPLVRHFIKKYCGKHGKPEKHLGRKTLARLKYCDWPGNVRELENMVSRAILFSQSDTLFPEDFDTKISESEAEIIQNAGSCNLGIVEKETIRQALSSFKTRKEAAAKLGITENTLKAKIDKYRLAHIRPPKDNTPKTEAAKPSEDKEKLSPEQRRILDHIRETGSINNKTARQMFGVAPKTIAAWCEELMDKGLIIREGNGRSARYVMNIGKTSKPAEENRF